LWGGGIGWFYSNNVVKPQYRSESTVILDQHQNTSDATLINNYISLLKSRKVLEPIIERNGLDVGYSQLHQNISIVNEKSTEIINIAVAAKSPDVAQRVNSDLIASFNLQSLGLSEDTGEKSRIITVIDDASYSDAAVNVKTMQNMLVVAAGMGVISVVVLFIVYDYRASRMQRMGARFVSRRARNVVGMITLPPRIETPAATVGDRRAQETESVKIDLIKREATDMLDVLQNIGGVEIRA
jgi:capsular polysaccharide biosynthesis protein